MLEQKRSHNNFQITKNEKEGHNKLNSYFQSSNFLTQQEQLSLFINHLPIIRMQQIKSINKLIEILIKQNQMLGNKCQQNILTIKEMYNKHQQLIKNNKLLQNNQNSLSKQAQNSKAHEVTLRVYEENILKMKQELYEKQMKINHLIEVQSISKHQNQYYHKSLEHLGGLIQLISQKNHKKVLQNIKDFNKNVNKENILSWINWQEIQNFIKDQKKKTKYFNKIKETVDIFCSRFIKISEFVPQQFLKEEFYKQKNNLLQFLDELLNLKKRNNYNSNSQSHITYHGQGNNFFEKLLETFLRQNENRSLTKQQITKQLFQAKQELILSKTSYEQYLIKIRIEHQEGERKLSEQLESKIQILEYYEHQKQEMVKDNIAFKNKLLQLEETIKAERHNLNSKSEQCSILQSKLEHSKNQMLLKQKQLRQQWDENIKTYQYKLSQKQQIIEQERSGRRQLQADLKEKINKYKIQEQKHEEQVKRLTKLLKEQEKKYEQVKQEKESLEKKYQHENNGLEKQLLEKKSYLEEYLRRIQKEMFQIKKLQDENSEYQRELKLNKEYIKELELKIQELNNKIKSIESKKSQEKTNKKEFNVMKQSVMEEKKYSKQVQQQFTIQKDENHRMKSMIKQMKRQLQEVYVQVNHLKVIERERQGLMKQIEKSDQIKEELYREYESMKIDLIKLTQQNKSLILENKHYRNALARIEALKI